MYRPSIVTWPFYPSGSYLGVVLHSITPDDNFAESSDRFPMTITTKTCCGNYCSRQYHYRSDLPDGMPFLIEMREFLVECCCKKKECCTESTPDTNTMHFGVSSASMQCKYYSKHPCPEKMCVTVKVSIGASSLHPGFSVWLLLQLAY